MSNITAWNAQGALLPCLLCLHGTALLIETPLEKGATGPERNTREDLQDGLITPGNQSIQLEMFTLRSLS